MTALVELTGLVTVAPGHQRRYRIGHDSGDVFSEDDDYDGVTLTIEATGIEDAQFTLGQVDAKGDYHEGIEEGWDAGSEQERRIWTMAIEQYFDATAVHDVERYVEKIRKGVEGE